MFEFCIAAIIKTSRTGNVHFGVATLILEFFPAACGFYFDKCTSWCPV